MDRKNLFVAGVAASFLLATAGAWAADTGTKSEQPVTDSVITTKVKAELTKDDQTKARHIKVSTKNGVVHLSGLVDSDAEKQKAEQDATTIEGVTRVKNSLKVRTASASTSPSG